MKLLKMLSFIIVFSMLIILFSTSTSTYAMEKYNFDSYYIETNKESFKFTSTTKGEYEFDTQGSFKIKIDGKWIKGKSRIVLDSNTTYKITNNTNTIRIIPPETIKYEVNNLEQLGKVDISFSISFRCDYAGDRDYATFVPIDDGLYEFSSSEKLNCHVYDGENEIAYGLYSNQMYCFLYKDKSYTISFENAINPETSDIIIADLVHIPY